MIDKFLKNKRETKWDPLYTINPLQKKNHPLNLSREQILALPEDQLDDYIETLRLEILDLYHNKHIPTSFGSMSLNNIRRKLKHFDRNNQALRTVYQEWEENKFLMCSNKTGLVVNFWFPEMVGTRIASAGNRSIIDGIENREKFHKNVRRIVVQNKMYLWGVEDKGTLRNDRPLFPTFSQGMRLGTGAQAVVNFLPIIAKWVYKYELSRWKDDSELYVLDTSMGWGGRMTGMLSASQFFMDKKINFIGTDPNTEISPHRYDMLYNFFNQDIRRVEDQFDFNPLALPAEDLHKNDKFQEWKGRGHVCLTSPPYFNRELYGNQEQEQSHSRYDQY